jgi:hypothetical protein
MIPASSRSDGTFTACVAYLETRAIESSSSMTQTGTPRLPRLRTMARPLKSASENHRAPEVAHTRSILRTLFPPVIVRHCLQAPIALIYDAI